MELDALRQLAVRILGKYGVEEEIAAIVADVLVDADARGVITHGLTRLPAYVARMRAGLIAPNARPRPVADHGAMVLLDGENGFGAVSGIVAADLAAERARRFGSAWVTVRNSNHLSMLGFYTRRLAAARMAAVGFSNAGASMAAWGGRAPVVGTNPISMATPGTDAPVVLDMAATQVARGKIRRAQSEGKAIPEGWAFDRDGRPTTDPDRAMEGTMAPMGGHKGYGLSVMIDLLSGVLSGGSFATAVRTATDHSGRSGVCFTLIAADMEKFPDADGFLDRLSAFRKVIESSGEGEIFLPGDLEDRRFKTALREGVDLPPDVMEKLQGLLAEP
ncbi:MAG: Ldh family oxidoreductase [Gammaproteobacteria bacterium]|nr:Ldh family oxidoreductase [Gammaproteobacteria bacterium]